MKKIDLHLHVLPDDASQKRLEHGITANKMIEQIHSLGIGKGVLMSGGENSSLVGDFAINKEVRQIAKTYPEHFVWMCNVDEREPETLCQRLSLYKSQGAIGIGELMINKRMDHPFLDMLFTCAEELNLPVTIHMSSEEGFKYGIVDEPGLPLLEDLLRRHPNLKILGHSQVFWIEISGDAPTGKEERYKTGKGPVLPGGRLVELFERYPNLYGDLSANSAGKAIMRDPDFGLKFLETFSNRLFFATDMINTTTIYPLGSWLDEQVSSGNLSKETYDNICFQNAQRILGL